MRALQQPDSLAPRALAGTVDYGVPLRPRHADEWEVEVDDQGGTIAGLYDYWRLLMRHKGVLVLAAVLGALLGVLASLPQTPVYRASTTLEIQGLNRDFLGMQNVNPTEHAGPMTSDTATQAELLKSRSLVEQVVSEMKLSDDELAKQSEGRLAAWKRALGLPEMSAEERFARAVGMARGSIIVSVLRNSRLINVSTDSTDPDLAARFANKLSDAFIRSNVESRWTATQYTEDWLDRQLEDLRIKLERSEDRLQSYARETGLLFTGDQESLAEEQLSRLQEQLSVARVDRIARQSQFELVESSPETALELIENPYRAELTRLRQELASLSSTFTDDYPEVRSLKARLSELSEASKAAQSQVLNNLRGEYQAALRRELLLDTDYRNQAGLVSELARKSIQYNILKREVDTSRQLYDNLLQKGKEARLSAAMQASPIRVVDAAVPPTVPFKPNHTRNSLLGLFLGIAGGIAFIIGRDRLDRTIKRPGDAEFYLNTPELGMIPSADDDKALRKGGKRYRIKIQKNGDNGLPRPSLISSGDHSANGSGLSRLRRPEGNGLFTLSDKTSHVAESFRSTLTSILFSGTHAAPARMIVVTSAFPQEGKSTVTSNLAAALAAINRSVLVIDGDMRRPRQHKVFGLPNTIGLTDLLLEPGPLSLGGRGGHPAILETHVHGLHLTPSGRHSEAPSNILHSPRAEEFLRWASETYDYVLIDTPPMVQLPDARLFARFADGVILVVRAGSTDREAALAAVERLRKDETNVLGVVLNGWNPAASDAHGYYGYYGKNGYHDAYFSDAAQEEEEEEEEKETV